MTLTVDGRADVQQAILGDWNVISSQPVVPDTSTVTFYRNDTDTVTLYDGCQFLGTHYDLDSDGSFHQLGNLDTTDIRCPSIPDSNAAALLAGIEALALNNEAATGYDHDGNVIMTLMRAAANEPTTSTDLNGTWNVRALVGPNGQSVLPDSARDNVRLTFADGEMTGTTGCNDVFGTYEQTGDNDQDLRFPRRQLGSTLVGCTDEPPLVSRLLEVRHVSGSAGVRYLHAVNWMIIAELRR
ncbi:MAG: META domain-containing protein [Sporichthyaceae bacterium]